MIKIHINMLRIETNRAGDSTRKHKLARIGLLYGYIFCLGANLCYGLFRWCETERIRLPIIFEFGTLRIILLLIMGMDLMLSILIVRSRWFRVSGQLSGVFPREMSQKKTSENKHDAPLREGPNSALEVKVQDIKPPRFWLIFERALFIVTGVLLLLSLLKPSPICTGLFSSSCITIPIFIEYPELGPIVDALGSLDLVILITYGSIKVPHLLHNVMDKYSRVYIGRWHIHESVFGIAWVASAAFWILFGDYYDRFIGLVFILQGAYLIGRDHVDVEKYAFIEKETAGE